MDGPDDVQAWIDTFDVTGEVGWDEHREVWQAYRSDSARPQYAVIDRDFVVIERTHSHDAAAQAAIDAL